MYFHQLRIQDFFIFTWWYNDYTAVIYNWKRCQYAEIAGKNITILAVLGIMFHKSDKKNTVSHRLLIILETESDIRM